MSTRDEDERVARWVRFARRCPDCRRFEGHERGCPNDASDAACDQATHYTDENDPPENVT